ncbi:MAG: hypothetical protein J5721_03885 [Lachnospiraceae bacterium]|nr:hypothetical protein [Lachnospiraceae bacterium]
MKLWRQRSFLPSLCVTGFLLGILFCLIHGQGGSLLAPERLRALSEHAPEVRQWTAWLILCRGKGILLITLLATTCLAPLCCGACAAWMGWSVGTILAASLLHYGIKGLFLFMAAIFPQWLFYGPGYYFLLEWCMELYGGSFQKNKLSRKVCLIRLGLILALLGGGIFLESLCCPKILWGFLAHF